MHHKLLNIPIMSDLHDQITREARRKREIEAIMAETEPRLIHEQYASIKHFGVYGGYLMSIMSYCTGD